jgi:conjugal transfer pilus assembly protein TraW
MQIILLALLTLCGNALAADLGSYGPIFLIKERDAYDWIVNGRLKELEESGEMDRIQQKMQENAKNRIENPQGFSLPSATKSNYKVKSLAYIAPKDIFDSAGKVLFHKGTRVEPNDLLPESNKMLIFFDGDNEKQVAYALQQLKKSSFTKVVLVSGKPLEFMRTHDVKVYFDQQQLLINKFEINALPAKVYRKGSNLIVEEVCLDA